MSWVLLGVSGQDEGAGVLGWPYLTDEILKKPLGGVNASEHLFLVLAEGQEVLRPHAAAPWIQVDTLPMAPPSLEDTPGPHEEDLDMKLGPVRKGCAVTHCPGAKGREPLGSIYSPCTSSAWGELCLECDHDGPRNSAVWGILE